MNCCMKMDRKLVSGLVPLNCFLYERYQEQVGKNVNKLTLFLRSSDDYHRAVNTTECSDSDDFEEVAIKKVKFSLQSPPATGNSVLEDGQDSGRVDSEVDGKLGNNAKGDSSVML